MEIEGYKQYYHDKNQQKEMLKDRVIYVKKNGKIYTKCQYPRCSCYKKKCSGIRSGVRSLIHKSYNFNKKIIWKIKGCQIQCINHPIVSKMYPIYGSMSLLSAFREYFYTQYIQQILYRYGLRCGNYPVGIIEHNTSYGILLTLCQSMFLFFFFPQKYMQ